MMNDANEISHHTKLYGFIGEEAGRSSLSAKVNKLLKSNNKDAMMIPMNIREDDFYFTVANMKKSHVNGAIISNEYVNEVVEILDDASEAVNKSGMCDILVRDGEKLVGDLFSIEILVKFLKDRDVQKVAMIGTNHYAKAFTLAKDDFELSYFNDHLENLMSFVTELGVADADINRIAEGMECDLSSFDAVVDFSDLQRLDMVKSLSPINMDMKQKKQFSPLKVRTNELEANYIGYEDMLDELSSGIFEFYKGKNHLDYDKSDMRF